MQRRTVLKRLGAVRRARDRRPCVGTPALAADTIKVGVLHSLSGTMAICETVLKDVALMTIDEINAKGGVLGKKLEPVVVDPASNWPLFAEKARQLISQDKVAVVFGCWTSVSRKSVLPVFEELNGLLFYPVQYEGEELSKNVFYTGAAPNQQAIPAVEYLMSKEGGGAKRFVLLGTDYVYPRTTNKILRAFLQVEGRRRTRTSRRSTRRSATATTRPSSPTSRSSPPGGKTGGGLDDQRRLQRAVLQGTRQPGPEGDRRAGRRVLGGRRGTARRRHQAAGRPPGGVELLHVAQEPGQRRSSRSEWAAYAKAKKLPGADKPLTNDPMEATYVGIHMWKQAVEKAKSTDTDKVIAAMAGQKFKAPDGFDDQDGREEPPPAQAGVHRRSAGRRSVQRRVEDAGPDPGAAVEPVHPEGNDKKKDEPEKK